MDDSTKDSPLFSCCLEINCSAIAANVAELRRRTKSRLMAVIKSNGYGLGLVEYARLLAGMGIREFAVGAYEEAMALRNAGIDLPILLLTPQISAEATKELLLRHVALTVGSIPQAQAVRRAAEETGLTPDIHVKIDTGLGRYGFQPYEMRQAAEAVTGMAVRGAYTHFSSPYTCDATTARQYETFLKAAERLGSGGAPPDSLHCCASGALLRYPQMHLDMVRPGSALIGRVPGAAGLGLTSAVSLKAPLVSVKPARAGGVGYRGIVGLRRCERMGVLNVGCAYSLPTPRRIASVFRKKQYAVINGQSAEILGPLGIGALAVDLTGIQCGEGDTAFIDVNPLHCAGTIRRVYNRGGLLFYQPRDPSAGSRADTEAGRSGALAMTPTGCSGG